MYICAQRLYIAKSMYLKCFKIQYYHVMTETIRCNFILINGNDIHSAMCFKLEYVRAKNDHRATNDI